ncbi:MAG: DUF362 domain-containing protein [bacterium]
MGKVSLVKINQGIAETKKIKEIKESLTVALGLIGGLGHYIDRNDRVMLKPNLNGLEGFTDKALVEALIQLLLDQNVREVFIAESTFGDKYNTTMLFNKTGFFELANNYGIDLINLNESEVIEAKVNNPLVLDRIRVAKEVYEADKIINLPNMKVHYATGISLALKNLKGLLVGDEKRHFHEVGLDKAIVDLNNTIQVHLNIVDAISCMERMGPRGGDIVKLDLIMAGENRAEVDYIGSLVMGYDISEVKHLEYYVKMNAIDLEKIETIGERIEDVSYPFKKVRMENIIPKKIKVHNKDACSSCMNAFLLSCSFLYGTLMDDIDVYIGSRVEQNGASGSMKIAFGNCCPKDMACDKRIKGCPPYPFTLGDYLKDYLK